jgi:phage terminase large subunit
MQVKLTNVFRRTAKAAIAAINNNGPRLIINQGGQGSSKTISILQVIYNILDESNLNRKTTFCSYALPHLKQGVISDFDWILDTFGKNIGLIKFSPAQPVYQINKSQINCYGIEGNLALAHGPRRKILYINECNRKVTYDVFDQLFSRSDITFLDFNPDHEFWLHDKVLPNFPYVLIKSNYKDNPYLPENEKQNILLKKDKPGFENWWKVYGEGELGNLEGAILTNWKFGKFDDTLPYAYGMDFGSKHPDAMVKVAIDRVNKLIYVKEEIYQNNLSTNQLAEIIRSRNVGDKLIIAESAAPRTIIDLKGKGFNIHPVVKPKIVDSIKMLYDYMIIVDEESRNLQRELTNWLWLDKKGEIPMDEFDHLIDAMRYIVHTLIKPGGIKRGNRIL